MGERATIDQDYLYDIADAIREKKGVTTRFIPAQMKPAILSIPTGGGVDVEALSVTANGTYTAPTGKAYSPVTVNVSGGGGGATILSGTGAPTAAQGNDGDIYLMYSTDDFDSAYVVDNTSQIMSTHSAAFRKNTADFALAMEIKPNNNNYKGPVVISPTAGGAAHTDNGTEYQVNIRGETWYFAGGNYWDTGSDSPTIPVNYSADIEPPSASTAQAWAELVYNSAYIGVDHITEAYLKVSGAWQPLIGSSISDVGGI